MKKFLTALLIGAFVFGVGATNMQSNSVEAKKSETPVADELKKKAESGEWKPFYTKDNANDNQKRPPEPPKDENGNPMPPPDRNGDNSNRPNHDGDNQNRPPEPPKDENGNPQPPPNHDGDNAQ